MKFEMRLALIVFIISVALLIAASFSENPAYYIYWIVILVSVWLSIHVTHGAMESKIREIKAEMGLIEGLFLVVAKTKEGDIYLVKCTEHFSDAYTAYRKTKEKGIEVCLSKKHFQTDNFEIGGDD